MTFLDELFGDTEDVKDINNIMIVDFSNILHSSFHGQVRFDRTLSTDKDKYAVWRYFLLNTLLSLKNKFAPDEIVLALDNKSWRKNEFKYYKANRVLAREKQSDFNATEFYAVCDQFIEEIWENFPYKMLKIDNAEADDIIGILASHFKQVKLTIVSRDKDFQQLLRTPNIVLYDPISKVFKKNADPYAFLLDHVIRGDAADGIPNLLSDDSVFVDSSKRSKAITKKVLREIYELGIEEYVMRKGLIRNYERNKQLVELSKDTIPKKIWTDTIYQYNNQNPTSNFMKVATFLRKHKIRSLVDKAGQFLL